MATGVGTEVGEDVLVLVIDDLDVEVVEVVDDVEGGVVVDDGEEVAAFVLVGVGDC